jgi:GDPmannose 4,6-dehydratase
MWLMLQNDSPENYVIASGTNYSVRDFVECAFSHVGLDYSDFVELDQRFYRPTESIPLKGDSSKIRQELNWQPNKNFDEIVAEMVEADLKYFSDKCQLI